MANFLDKFKINTAVTENTKLDLSSDHISTANFMQFNVAYAKELVPGEKISVNMETFTRLQPMPVPTFGRARINNRAFFVPFRTIFPGWNDFITDTKHAFSNGTAATINYVPRISANTIFAMLFGQVSQTTNFAELDDTLTNPDYVVTFTGSGNVTHKYKLTSTGRQVVKILQSLGYVVPVSKQSSIDVYYSALPLLATAKVYHDWYWPSAYADDVTSETIAGIFNRDDSADFVLSQNELTALLNMMEKVCYDSDYFVSAWQNPTAPNTGSFSGTRLYDVTNDNQNSVNVNDSNGTTIAGSGNLSQYVVDALKSLTDYMKRHQLVGARALDRYMARFGIQLSAEKLRRSVYIGSTSDDIQFGDIMSTADTEGAQLGNYAGKGLGYGTSNFDFDTDEYGMFIIVSSILPKAGYFQGLDRSNMHVGRLDYWTPEFDNLGTQAIAKSELYYPTDSTSLNVPAYQLDKGVFGWTPRYAEYKIGKDRITGDFRYESMNAGIESWHTMRMLDYDNVQSIVINKEFVTGTDAGQYSRIFYNTDADAADKFNVIYHFDIASYSPMKALFDTYEFEDKGEKVVMNANGVKMN